MIYVAKHGMAKSSKNVNPRECSNAKNMIIIYLGPSQIIAKEISAMYYIQPSSHVSSSVSSLLHSCPTYVSYSII